MFRRSRFAWCIAAAFALAVVLRWAVTVRYYRDLPLGFTDNYYYHSQAGLLAEGRGFLNPFTLLEGRKEPAAAHPPLYSLYLAMWSLLGASTPLWHRLASGLISATAVVPVVMTVARLAGRRAGAVAGAVVAVYPAMWMNDGLILSESLYIPLAAVTIWQSYRVLDQPSAGRVVGLSAVLAAIALTRAESFLLFAVLLAPLLWRLRAVAARHRLRLAVGAAVAAAVILAPWVGRNLIVFEKLTFLSTGHGFVLELANCDTVYSGPLIGYWSSACASEHWVEGDVSAVSADKFDRARRYIGDHLSRQPAVAAARAARLFGLFRPFQNADFDVFFERRIGSHVRVGLWSHWALSMLAVGGAVVLWRRRLSPWPPAALIVAATLTAAVAFGITRYRSGADVAIVVLAGIALGSLLDRLDDKTGWRWFNDRSQDDPSPIGTEGVRPPSSSGIQ